MNDYTDHHSVCYKTIQDACRIAKQGYYCANLDLKLAYVGLCQYTPMTTKPQAWPGSLKELTAIPFYLMLDCCLAWRMGRHISVACLMPYGESCTEKDTTVYVCNKGVINHTDNFPLACATFEECNEALHYLIHFLRRLGLHMSWTKVIGPTQHVTFLGVDIDTVECTLSLGHAKLSKLHGILKTFKAKQWATKVQLQSLAGSLNWACQVVRGGCFFL